MKTLNLLGIRQRTILCHFNNIAKDIAVLIPITDEQVKEIEENEKIIINDKLITRENIYCYGDIDLTNEEDVEFIKKFNLINDDYSSNVVYSNFNYEKGNVEYDGPVPKQYSTNNIIDWFKFNYMLIGKPKNVLIYKCRKHDL